LLNNRFQFKKNTIRA